jgi:hypothetical protein
MPDCVSQIANTLRRGGAESQSCGRILFVHRINTSDSRRRVTFTVSSIHFGEACARPHPKPDRWHIPHPIFDGPAVGPGEWRGQSILCHPANGGFWRDPGMPVRLTHREHHIGQESRLRSFVPSTRIIGNAHATYRRILQTYRAGCHSCTVATLRDPSECDNNRRGGLPYCIGPRGMNLQDFYSLGANHRGLHHYSRN